MIYTYGKVKRSPEIRGLAEKWKMSYTVKKFENELDLSKNGPEDRVPETIKASFPQTAMTNITEKPPKKQAPRRESRKPWSRKKTLNSGNSLATFEFFQNNLHYNALNSFERVFSYVFWTKRYNRHSLQEIKKDVKETLKLDISLRELRTMFALIECEGYCKNEKRYLRETNIQARSYRVLTKKGRAFMNAIINKARFETPIPKENNPGIELLQSQRKESSQLVCRRRRDFRAIDKKRADGNDKEILNIHSNGILRIQDKCQGEPLFARYFSIENGVISHDEHVWSRKRFDSGSATDSKIQNSVNKALFQTKLRYFHPWTQERLKLKFSISTNTHREIFQKWGIEKQFDNFKDFAKILIGKQPAAKIERILKHIFKSHAKGQRIKHFGKFFCYLLRQETLSFHRMRAETLRQSIAGKQTRLNQGHDTSLIIEMVRGLEKETGQAMDIKTLERLMKNPQKFKRSLEAVEYRRKLDPNREEAPKEQEQGKPIYREEMVAKQIEVYSPKLGKSIIREVQEKQRVLVGYERVHRPKPKEPRRKLKPIRNWIATCVWAFNLTSIEKINETFFHKREVAT